MDLFLIGLTVIIIIIFILPIGITIGLARKHGASLREKMRIYKKLSIYSCLLTFIIPILGFILLSLLNVPSGGGQSGGIAWMLVIIIPLAFGLPLYVIFGKLKEGAHEALDPEYARQKAIRYQAWEKKMSTIGNKCCVCGTQTITGLFDSSTGGRGVSGTKCNRCGRPICYTHAFKIGGRHYCPDCQRHV